MNEEQCWQAVLAHDATADGKFVYAVRTTGIYCRPSCPSRRPQRANVDFFPQPADAERANFRPCQRCRPQGTTMPEAQAELAQQVCQYIEEHLDEPLTLETLSTYMGFSPYHLQRTFKRIMGISPRQYTEARRMARFKTELKQGTDVTDAIYSAGYGSSSGVYSKASAQLGMTPTAYRRGGDMQQMSYTIVDCPLGRLLVAATERGICAITLGDDDQTLVSGLRAEYPAASIQRDDEHLRSWVAELTQHLSGTHPHLDLPLDVRATAFQRRVWEALQAIPYGSTRSYHEIAEAIGQPNATRAVARACATNPVALAIPCHRVIREDGQLGGYRWGLERKRALLEKEGLGFREPETWNSTRIHTD